jgi:hypothetical protein
LEPALSEQLLAAVLGFFAGLVAIEQLFRFGGKEGRFVLDGPRGFLLDCALTLHLLASLTPDP